MGGSIEESRLCLNQKMDALRLVESFKICKLRTGLAIFPFCEEVILAGIRFGQLITASFIGVKIHD